jgi:hypothetical protein
MIDLDDNRLQLSTRFDVTGVINNKDNKAVLRNFARSNKCPRANARS